VTRLLLARHGESEWNAIGRWQGWADPELTDLGRRQAAAAAAAVGALDAIVASDLRRAHETASIIAGALGIGPVIVDAALRERDAGPWTGLTRAEIERDFPGFLADGRRPEGYEDDDAVVARVVPALVALERAGEAVLVITHGGVIGAVDRLLDQPHARTPNLGGRIVDVRDGRLTAGETLLLVDEHDVTVTRPAET
jgi:probable phosphoglycerate mutase